MPLPANDGAVIRLLAGLLALGSGLPAQPSRPGPVTVAEARRLGDPDRRRTPVEVAIRGVVTTQPGLFKDPRDFYFQDQTGGLLVRAGESPSLNVGDSILATGRLTLTEAGEYRFLAHRISDRRAGQPPAPRAVELGHLISGACVGELVTLNQVATRVASSRPISSIYFGADGNGPRAFLPVEGSSPLPFRDIRARDRVQATGICMPRLAEGKRYGFQIRLRSAADAAVTGRLAEVSTETLVWLAGLLLAGALAAVVWIVALRRAVRRKTKEIQRLLEEARTASEAKSAFLASMSHEIRTPMNGVLGMTEVLLQSELTPAQRDCAETVRFSAMTLLGLLNDLLDFSKIEAGKLEIERIPFSPGEVIRRAASLHQTLAAAKDLSFELDIAPSVPDALRGDPVRLSQALSNLLSNAVKFTHSGGVVCRAGAQASAPGSVLLTVEVCDTGIGMTGEQRGRLFEVFRQGDASTTRKYGGTGLGMAITKRVVEAMGGRIGVTSVPGEGTSFRLEIPFLVVPAAGVEGQPAARPPVSVSAPQPAGPSRPRVLVVEDNVVNQKVICHLLENAGCEALIAGDGLQALEMAGREPCDLVLMDVQMPELDGLEATRRLRRTARGSRIPVVAMTAHAMAGDRERCLEAGMDGYLAKPVQVAELAAELARWLPGRLPA